MPGKRTETLLQYLGSYAVLLCSALPGHGSCGIDCFGLVLELGNLGCLWTIYHPNTPNIHFTPHWQTADSAWSLCNL